MKQNVTNSYEQPYYIFEEELILWDGLMFYFAYTVQGLSVLDFGFPCGAEIFSELFPALSFLLPF